MRIISVITALLVTVFLFFLVMQRERLLEFAGLGATSSNAISEPGEMEERPSAEQDSDIIGVVAIHSNARIIDSAVPLRGQTAAARMVEVRAETSAKVISQPLRKGNFVKTGQLLCELDPGTRLSALAEAEARLSEARARTPESQARLSEAEARLDEARINYNAASKLSKDGYASDTRVISTQANVRAAEAAIQSAISGLNATEAGIQAAAAAVASAQKEIERLKITAPFEGLLESDAAETGSLMQPGQLCATVIQLDPIKLVGFVPETDVGRVQLDAPATARLASGAEVQGHVTFVSRAADPATRTFRVEITVDNADLQIRDGQTADILVSAEGAEAHLLPQSALTLSDDGALGVRVVTAQKQAEFMPVTLLRDTAQGVWVSGLPERADVIIIGQEYVIDGVPVRARFQEVGQ